ncbi:hypothetical protein LRD18_04840 [Halorhodospira halochloris]|uniref:Uncharacterized protein n=1 Tax=Halorhodospira halochloris TaxID=1052 RepID=A0A0X8X884_HALHR|nr:hypothetical protein [Halorhodospira halochloris]MBK1651452.1 hypothetical protein [Halorhodospira halochloris]MCG5530200.1 hypothetical protein [Halorhodospira halochloris]MCG5548058.1 hypothetical protein [Halorhodospira halochloris]BAU57289.1 hypothetical protein HH1059_06020 [Halorhodospira halochloris]
MDIDTSTWSGKLIVSLGVGVGLTLFLMIAIAITLDPRLISLSWMLTSILVGSGIGYVLMREKGVI